MLDKPERVACQQHQSATRHEDRRPPGRTEQEVQPQDVRQADLAKEVRGHPGVEPRRRAHHHEVRVSEPGESLDPETERQLMGRSRHESLCWGSDAVAELLGGRQVR